MTFKGGVGIMLQGWGADGAMPVDDDGGSNVVIQARRKGSKVVAGASLTGVPIHILHRDNGE